MKLRMFATAAVVAAALSTPALAQSATGSVGVSASQVEVEVFGFEGDGQTYAIDGSVAFKASEAWTVTLQGSGATSSSDLGDDETFAAGAALTYAGSDWRVGPAVTYSDLGSEGLWTVGGVAQKYFDTVTLAGAVSYGNIDDVDADIWSFGGEARFFVSDNFRVDAGVTYASADVAGTDVDGWSLGLGGEYQFAGTPWSLTGGYTHATVDDADLSVDTFTIGVRYSFGGDLKARDRSGANLGAGSNPFASAF
ncbi:MAG: hypothetical protein Q7J28_09145 [Caulobacter sp.]|nr:hypothetical protein [Caulobacter sp.]